MSTKVNFDFRSIRFKLWMYFLSVSVGIILLIWGLQIVLLENSYDTMKADEVDKVASDIYDAYHNDSENFNTMLQELSISDDYYFIMESGNGYLLFTPESETRRPIHTYMTHASQLRETLDSRNKRATSFTFNGGMREYDTLAYGCVLDNTSDGNVYLYIFTPLYPVTSAVTILKNMFMAVTFVALAIAFISALFFATKISRPLKAMTATAKEMGKGNYNVKFEGDSYSEVKNLANTLNTAAYELGRADIRQKDLIANVSHDLKTPLTMIKSYAEMIRDLSGENPVKRNAHLQVIIDESDRLTSLVNDMATISAMQTHRMKLDKTVFNLSETAETLLASYDILEERDGYTFKTNIQKDCMVKADQERIKQVISNLVSNAIKYCGEDKLILVNVKRTGKVCRLEVSDHGPGIAPEELPHVWDRYYKTSTNYVRETEGTGLGLSIVKEILTLHYVNYGVNSRVGKGTTFWFELPSEKKEKEKQEVDYTKEIPRDPEHIEELG